MTLASPCFPISPSRSRLHNLMPDTHLALLAPSCSSPSHSSSSHSFLPPSLSLTCLYSSLLSHHHTHHVALFLISLWGAEKRIGEGRRTWRTWTDDLDGLGQWGWGLGGRKRRRRRTGWPLGLFPMSSSFSCFSLPHSDT